MRARSWFSPGAAIRASARCIGCATRSRTAGRAPLEIEEHSHAGHGDGLCGGRVRSAVRRAARLPRHRSAEVQPANQIHRVPVHRRAAGRGAGDPPRRRRDPRAEGRSQGQRADVGHGRRAEGSGDGGASGRSSPSRRSSTGSTRRRTRWCCPRWVVGAVCEVPGGAFPSYAQGYYARNNAFYKAWDEIARERESFHAWIERHVLATADFAEFQAQPGRGRDADG